MISRVLTKIKFLVKQNLFAFLIIGLWFLCNYVYFYLLTSSYFESVYILFYFKENDSLWGTFYANFTEFIIFGLIFSLITIDLFRKYNPEETCRDIAHKLEDHAIIIGYNHLGQRLANFFDKIGVKFVIIESEKKYIEELINDEKPVIHDDVRKMDTLNDANIQKARAVYITSDNLEVLLVGCAHIRMVNRSCKLVCRVFHDDIADLISTTYKATTISTSKYASNRLINKIESENFQNLLIIGLNHISYRISKKLEKYFPNIRFHIIEEDEEIIEDILLENQEHLIIGDPKDRSILEKVDIQKIDCVINVTTQAVQSTLLITKRIRELNPKCKIITRLFLDSIAEILENPPFNSQVMSSSKDTLDYMKKKRLLNF
ncbi:MAG: hypothetical protein GF383_02870 [Candidatus Lokiarchaeota archaeon]|nr:hypothetical protein [Candidatus Lokiarchaeota archaeon]MBD3338457.1 hypothetical protein [Candidatus Lokiarchaeota archaeon]